MQKAKAMSEHALAHALWVLNALLAAASAYLTIQVVRGRGERIRAERAETQADASRILMGRPAATDIFAAWQLVLGDAADFPAVLTNEGFVAALCEADRTAVSAMREAVERSVRSYNDFATLVDEGIIQPRGFVRRFPDLHRSALIDLALMEPFIWYDSLVCGRGRWGYRPLQLKWILDRSRPISDDANLCRRLDVVMFERSCAMYRRIRLPERTYLRITGFIWPPTISVHTKLRQKKYARTLRNTLQRRGFAVASAERATTGMGW